MHALGFGDRPRPELLGAALPDALEDAGDSEHRHVAAHTVAERGEAREFGAHLPRQLGIVIIELRGVGPRRKVRIAAVGQCPRACRRVCAQNQRSGCCTTSISVPPMYQSGCSLTHGWSMAVWLGMKSRISACRALRSRCAEGGQRRVAAEFGLDVVAADRIGRTGDVGWLPVGQGPRVVGLQARMHQRHLAAASAGQPDAHQPDGIEAAAFPAREFLLGNLGSESRGVPPPSSRSQTRVLISRINCGGVMVAASGAKAMGGGQWIFRGA